MAEKPERPRVTNELICAASAEFCERHKWNSDQSKDLAKVYAAHLDGYELAKALDDKFGWDIDEQVVETLGCFSNCVREAHRKMCLAWAKENNIQPPLPVGTMTTVGEITGIYAHDAACYEIKRPGDRDTTRSIVRFEEARAVDALSAVV